MQQRKAWRGTISDLGSGNIGDVSETGLRPPQPEQMDIAVESDRWFRQFWLHAAMLALMLGALSFVLNNGSIAIVDEGVYSAQASALSGGSWSTPQYLKNVDPTGVHNALIGPTVADGRVIAYAHHPAYPLTLAPIVHVGGYQAMLLRLLG